MRALLIVFFLAGCGGGDPEPVIPEAPEFVHSFCAQVNALGWHCNVWKPGGNWTAAWGFWCWDDPDMLYCNKPAPGTRVTPWPQS